MRFLGIKNNRIFFVSEVLVESDEFKVLEVPAELSHLSSKELITDCRFENNQLIHKYPGKPAKELKIALVGNWKTKCGIATYAENLWSEVVKHVGDFKLFVEDDSIVGDICSIGNIPVPQDKVSVCWKRGEPLSKLSREIKKYNPDIVWIQHEFGLWPNARYWLSLMNQLSSYRVIVTMHSVFHHRDKMICEAAMPEIVTHLSGGFEVLKNEKQIPGKVHVIPHGCFPCHSREKLWNMYKSDRTFVQFGFGFRYKGWENAIKATAILKEKYHDVFFTGLFSESDHAKLEHQVYYNELMDLVDQLSLQDNVALIRGFQSDNTIDAFLRTNRATLFPYISHPEHEVYGASGAARIAMSTGLPVITSSVNHFSDLPTLKADSPEEIARALEMVFSDYKFKDAQIEKQLKYLQENTWEKIAQRYIQLFESP